MGRPFYFELDGSAGLRSHRRALSKTREGDGMLKGVGGRFGDTVAERSD
jgi:hypothetical protein